MDETETGMEVGTSSAERGLREFRDTDELFARMQDAATAASRTVNNLMAFELRLRSSIRELQEGVRRQPEPHLPNALPKMTIAEFKDLLTRKEVAEQVGVCTETLRKMYSEGRFPKPIQLSSRRLRFRRSDVERWIRGEHDPD